MNVWYHLSTIFNRRYVLRLAGILSLCVALITMLFFVAPAHAAPGVNKTISFQGRLLTSAGVPVPNGFYNIQFKIYEGGTGATVGNPDGELAWTETYINNGGQNGVKVTNGYMSVNLGSQTAFGNSVDWNEDTLWLSMNIAGLASGCSTFNSGICEADGEMTPMKRLTSTPYALNAGMLGGVSADGYLRLDTNEERDGSFNISGVARANTLQGNTSVIAPLFDRADTGSLSIGATNATDIAIGSATASQTISIGSGSGSNIVTIGSNEGTSATTIQGGSGGVAVMSHAGFAVQANNGYNNLAISTAGNITVRTGTNQAFNVLSSNSDVLFGINDSDNTISTGWNTLMQVRGTAQFEKGFVIQGGAYSNDYVTPQGYSIPSALSVSNYTVGNQGSVLSLGLLSGSAANARGIVVADARTGTHQPSIGVLSPNDNQIMGFSWNGSNTTGYVSNTASTVVLQGNGLDLITATNQGGQARIGIGNAANSGYALDVTGDTNTSGQFRIGGATTLTNSTLAFTGPSTSSITSANGQSLNVDGKNGVTIQTNGATRASFTNTNIQIGNNSGVGQPILLTLDKASSAPSGLSTAMRGSMYYNTALGKVQCYEATGWGNCGSSPDTFVSMSPEYANSITNGSTLGTFRSDICSDTLGINNGSLNQPLFVCDFNETYNFYHWTSGHAIPQTKSIYVTYQLPANFNKFVADSTSIMGRVDTTDAHTSYSIYRNTSDGLIECSTNINIATGFQQNVWTQGTAYSVDDPANCGFEAGDSIMFKIDLSAFNDANAYVSTLNFAYSTK